MVGMDSRCFVQPKIKVKLNWWYLRADFKKKPFFELVFEAWHEKLHIFAWGIRHEHRLLLLSLSLLKVFRNPGTLGYPRLFLHIFAWGRRHEHRLLLLSLSSLKVFRNQWTLGYPRLFLHTQQFDIRGELKYC